MSKGLRRHAPALFVSSIALFAALGGSVYAAGKISGNAIKAKSLPGNRLRLHSVPGNRLKPGAIAGSQLQPNSITGAQVDEATLTQVANARHADTADRADSATRADSANDAQTALNAVNAVNASTVNGHSAGCLPGTQLFAGACWQSSSSATAATAPNAAVACASQGGALPEALQLAAFAQQAGVALDGGTEWSSDILSYSVGPYGVATVSPSSTIGSGTVNPAGGSEARKYRCVIPLVT